MTFYFLETPQNPYSEINDKTPYANTQLYANRVLMARQYV